MADQNTFRLEGGHAVLLCPNKAGTLHEVLVDIDKLREILEFGFWRIYDKSHNPAKPLMYAYSSRKPLTISMHRFVMNAPPRLMVDHRERNTLDNRAEKLRISSHSLNALNQRRHDGMCVYHVNNRYQVRVEINQVQRFLGSFISEQAAKDCRDEFLRTQGVQI